MKYPPYHSAVVSYVDLLGFREMVAKSVEHKDGTSYIEATLENVQGIMDTESFAGHTIDDASRLRTYSFSDLVLRTVAVSDADQLPMIALNEIIHLALVQCDRVSYYPLLLRGG